MSPTPAEANISIVRPTGVPTIEPVSRPGDLPGPGTVADTLPAVADTGVEWFFPSQGGVRGGFNPTSAPARGVGDVGPELDTSILVLGYY